MINQQISTDFSTHSTLPSPWLSGVSDPRPRCDHSTVAERTERLSCPSFVGSHELLKSSLVKGYAAESAKQTTSCENRLSFFVSIELLDRHESSNDYDSLGEGFKCRDGDYPHSRVVCIPRVAATLAQWWSTRMDIWRFLSSLVAEATNTYLISMEFCGYIPSDSSVLLASSCLGHCFVKFADCISYYFGCMCGCISIFQVFSIPSGDWLWIKIRVW